MPNYDDHNTYKKLNTQKKGISCARHSQWFGRFSLVSSLSVFVEQVGSTQQKRRDKYIQCKLLGVHFDGNLDKSEQDVYENWWNRSAEGRMSSQMFTRKYVDDFISVFRQILHTNTYTLEYVCPLEKMRWDQKIKTVNVFHSQHTHIVLFFAEVCRIHTIYLNWFVYNGCYESQTRSSMPTTTTMWKKN